MKKLSELRENEEAVVAGIEGDARTVGRLTSIGLTPGCLVRAVKNDRNRPILIYSRDTMIALNRNECSGILVEPDTVRGREAGELRDRVRRTESDNNLALLEEG